MKAWPGVSSAIVGAHDDVMWGRAIIIAMAGIITSQQGSVGRRAYFPTGSTSYYKTDTHEKTDTDKKPASHQKTDAALKTYPHQKTDTHYYPISSLDGSVKENYEMRTRNYFPVTTPTKTIMRDNKEDEIYPNYPRSPQLHLKNIESDTRYVSNDITMQTPVPHIITNDDGPSLVKDKEKNAATNSEHTEHQVAESTGTGQVAGDIRNTRLIEKERICHENTCPIISELHHKNLAYPDPCILPSEYDQYDLTIPGLHQKELTTAVCSEEPPTSTSPEYTYFRDPEHVMLNPSLPAGTPYNLQEKREHKQKFNLSQTVVDGEVSLSANNDPHLEKPQILHKINKKKGRRRGRLFSIFSLVRFKNTECTPSTTTSSSYTGTCYLATQCQEKVRL